MDTLLLDHDNWDLVLDSAGNIALASNPYSLAQDAASGVKLFVGELWYDTTKGVPYFTEILGHYPPLALVKKYNVATALAVPGVVAADCFLTDYTDRVLRGQLQVTDQAGVITTIEF